MVVIEGYVHRRNGLIRISTSAVIAWRRRVKHLLTWRGNSLADASLYFLASCNCSAIHSFISGRLGYASRAGHFLCEVHVTLFVYLAFHLFRFLSLSLSLSYCLFLSLSNFLSNFFFSFCLALFFFSLYLSLSKISGRHLRKTRRKRNKKDNRLWNSNAHSLPPSKKKEKKVERPWNRYLFVERMAQHSTIQNSYSYFFLLNNVKCNSVHSKSITFSLEDSFSRAWCYSSPSALLKI